jgi:hypothetical protein
VSAVHGPVTTVEGLSAGDRLHPVQQAFIDEQAPQCGYCTSGMAVAAAGLLRDRPAPAEREVREALDGNLCRCGTHGRIIRAVLTAAGRMSDGPAAVSRPPAAEVVVSQVPAGGTQPGQGLVLPSPPPGEWSVAGRSAPRLDIPDKVTGRPRFLHDLVLPGMAYGRVMRPPARCSRGSRPAWTPAAGY